MNRVTKYLAASTTIAAVSMTCLVMSADAKTAAATGAAATGAAATGAAAVKSASGYDRQDYGADPYRRNAQDSDGWGTKCAKSSQLGRVTFSSGSFMIRKELVPLVSNLIFITESRYGYKLKAGQTWGMACRSQRGSSKLSNHALGRALDINSAENPMSSRFASTIPPALVHLWESHGFDWGGYYSKRYDTMHFEFADNIKTVPRYTNSILRYRYLSTRIESTNYRGRYMMSHPWLQSWLGHRFFGFLASRYRIQPGLAGKGFSLESTENPGWFVRHLGSSIVLYPYSATSQFRNDASFTWDRVNGNVGAMRSLNYPAWSIRHYNSKFELGHPTSRPGTPYEADSLFIFRTP